MIVNLTEIPTRAPKHLNKEETKEITESIIQELVELQNLLYAEGKHAVLVLLQGMDASGKDGVVRKVLGRINPQGVNVVSFKVPTEEELAHDFLWRVHQKVPPRGHITVFNRSHYEDVLVTRVHGWCDDELAKKRMDCINDFEKLLQQDNSTHILKFYLHVSAEEQMERLMERTTDPAKMWKYNKRDFAEAKLRDKYYTYYQQCFEHCNKPDWIIVPADQNWYKEYIIAKTLKEKLQSLNMKYPQLEI